MLPTPFLRRTKGVRKRTLSFCLPHGPHNVRDVLATHILKQTGSYQCSIRGTLSATTNGATRQFARVHLRSGRVFQVDIIPTPTPMGTALNCEDAVAFAEAKLRDELAANYPETWARIVKRQEFMDRCVD